MTIFNVRSMRIERLRVDEHVIMTQARIYAQVVADRDYFRYDSPEQIAALRRWSMLILADVRADDPRLIEATQAVADSLKRGTGQLYFAGVSSDFSAASENLRRMLSPPPHMPERFELTPEEKADLFERVKVGIQQYGWVPMKAVHEKGLQVPWVELAEHYQGIRPSVLRNIWAMANLAESRVTVENAMLAAGVQSARELATAANLVGIVRTSSKVWPLPIVANLAERVFCGDDDPKLLAQKLGPDYTSRDVKTLIDDLKLARPDRHLPGERWSEWQWTIFVRDELQEIDDERTRRLRDDLMVKRMGRGSAKALHKYAAENQAKCQAFGLNQCGYPTTGFSAAEIIWVKQGVEYPSRRLCRASHIGTLPETFGS
jgi:hypothetical protein